MAMFTDGGSVGRRPAPHPLATIRSLIEQRHPRAMPRLPMPGQFPRSPQPHMPPPDIFDKVGEGQHLPGPPRHAIPPNIIERLHSMAQAFQRPSSPFNIGPAGLTDFSNPQDMPGPMPHPQFSGTLGGMIGGGQFGGYTPPQNPYGSWPPPNFHPISVDTFLPWTLDPRNQRRPQ